MLPSERTAATPSCGPEMPSSLISTWPVVNPTPKQQERVVGLGRGNWMVGTARLSCQQPDHHDRCLAIASAGGHLNGRFGDRGAAARGGTNYVRTCRGSCWNSHRDIEASDLVDRCDTKGNLPVEFESDFTHRAINPGRGRSCNPAPWTAGERVAIAGTELIGRYRDQALHGHPRRAHSLLIGGRKALGVGRAALNAEFHIGAAPAGAEPPGASPRTTELLLLSWSRLTGRAVARLTAVGKCWPRSGTVLPALTNGWAVEISGLKNDGTPVSGKPPDGVGCGTLTTGAISPQGRTENYAAAEVDLRLEVTKREQEPGRAWQPMCTQVAAAQFLQSVVQRQRRLRTIFVIATSAATNFWPAKNLAMYICSGVVGPNRCALDENRAVLGRQVANASCS